MPYHDSHYSAYGDGYSSIEKYWNKENLVARDVASRYSLRKADDHYFWTEDWCEDDKGKIIPGEYQTLDDYKVVKMYHDGTIILNLETPPSKRGHVRFVDEATIEHLHHILPVNVHMFLTGGRKYPKTFVMWNPKESVRDTSHYAMRKIDPKPTVMWEITSKKLTFLPNGKVEGATLRKRGKKVIIDVQPLIDLLEPKHIKEMTKARLDGVLEVIADTKRATFRTMDTGLTHCVLELVRSDTYGHYGPNDGLITRISVGRFVNEEEVKRCNQIAWDICKDLPTSIKSGIINGDRPQV